MSEDLALETKDYVTKALKNAQDNARGAQAWCYRDPKKWCKVAQHIIQKPTSAYSFIKAKNCTKNFYYDVQTELFADPEAQLIRNAWASEVAAIQFQGIDTFRASQEKYSEAVEEGDIDIDGNELFKQAKALQAFNDIHGKLTGNNIQKHVVEHVVTQDDYDTKMAELKERMKKAKQAEEAEEVIDVD